MSNVTESGINNARGVLQARKADNQSEYEAAAYAFAKGEPGSESRMTKARAEIAEVDGQLNDLEAVLLQSQRMAQEDARVDELKRKREAVAVAKAALARRAVAAGDVKRLISELGAAFKELCDSRDEAFEKVRIFGRAPLEQFAAGVGSPTDIHVKMGAMLVNAGLTAPMYYSGTSENSVMRTLDFAEYVKARQDRALEGLVIGHSEVSNEH